MTERRAKYSATSKARYPGTEHDDQVAIFRWAEGSTGLCPELALLFAIPNGGKRDRITAARMKDEGVKPGVPDICLPVARNGYHGLFIELKHGDNDAAPAQRAWITALLKQGYLAVVSWDVDATIKLIEDYLRG